MPGEPMTFPLARGRYVRPAGSYPCSTASSTVAGAPAWWASSASRLVTVIVAGPSSSLNRVDEW